MSQVQNHLPHLIAAGVPLLFLFLAYSLDLYNTHSLRLIAIAFLWGGVLGVGISYGINTHITRPLLALLSLRYILLYILFAPIVEELVKMVPLALYFRRGQLTFFIDGAIYGFATGIGFSIGETLIYISRFPELGVSLAIGRALSTSLMHGAAAALMGVGYGFARLRRFRTRKGLIPIAWLLAVTFHGLFNAWAISNLSPALGVLGAMAIGLGSFELLLLCIRLGLKEEKIWLEETIDLASLKPLMGMLTPVERQQVAEALEGHGQMSLAEIRATQEYEDLDVVLRALREQFPRQVDQMEQIIFQQAQIAIKRRLIWEIGDSKVQARLQAQVTALQASTERLRSEVGVCALSYLNCVFDDEGKAMQVCVSTVTSCAPPWELDSALSGERVAVLV
jgi:RsiW-degrading membrane proteinase PrsW (M82 family)